MKINVGDKIKWTGKSEELLHVLEVKNGQFEARVNGSTFVAQGPVASLIDSKQFVHITDEEYNTKLDAFWASGIPQGERQE